MAVTQKKIAECLGVSQQLVSFALNGTGTVSKRQRSEIQATAQAMGYRRNELARAMTTGKSYTLGLLRFQSKHEQSSYMLDGILEGAEAQGYSVKVFLFQTGVDQRTIERCVESRVSGVILMYTSRDVPGCLYEELDRHHIPLVILDNSFAQPRGVRIACDNRQGMTLAVEHLVALGHRHMGFIGFGMGAAMLRERSFCEAMERQGLPVLPQLLRSGITDIAHSGEVAKELLSTMAPRPTAIVCSADSVAMHVCRAARQAGLRVPDDLSVVGFDDLMMAPCADPPLTTLAQPFHEMGRVAVRHLLERIGDAPNGTPEKDDAPLEELLPVRLVVRQSTAPPAIIAE